MTTSTIKRQFICLGFMLVLSSQLLAQPGKTYLVTNANDSGLGSLRAAVDSTNTNPNQDTITFSNAIDGDSIKLSMSIEIIENVVIKGNGTSHTIIDGLSVDQSLITTSDTIEMHGLTIQNGGGSGPPFLFGGGLSLDGDAKIISCNFHDNLARGGGAINASNGNITLIGCVFSNNSAITFEGGAIYFDGGDLWLSNCLFYDNHAARLGGAVYQQKKTNLFISNATLVDNSSNILGGGLAVDDSASTLQLYNSILAGNLSANSADIYRDMGATVDLQYNVLCDTIGIGVFPGMIVGIPDFLDTATNNFQLVNTSLGLNTGLNALLPKDSCDLDNDGNLDEQLPLDLAANPRIIRTNVDIGAYELNCPLLVSNTLDSGPGSLRAMVNCALDGDTIRFDPSINGDTIKLLDQIEILNSIAIIGNDTTNTILDAGDSSRIFAISADDVQLTRLRIQNGQADEGGGIFSSKRMGINQCAILNCTSPDKGGGINCLKPLKIENSNISFNRSQGEGGGVYCADSTIILKSTISYNRNLDRDGGGIYSGGCTIIDSCTISHNYAEFLGGGVYTTLKGTIYNSTVSHDTTQAANGGGIYGSDSLDIKNCKISNNHSSNDGGGIYSFDHCDIIASSILNNRANSDSGGGINGQGDVVVDSCTISNNYAGSLGGGISTEKKCTIYNSTVSQDTAQSGSGGGIFCSDSLDMKNCEISNNRSELQGGGICSGTQSIISSSLVLNNRSNDSGGGICGYGNIEIDSSTISHSYSANDGGGIYSEGKVFVDSCNILDNYAGRSGGGIYALSTCMIYNSSVRQDTAQNGEGGGIYSTDSTDIKNCEITHNFASNDGGGVYSNNPSHFSGASILNNRSVNGDGGGIYSLSDLVFDSCTISHNYSASEGGGIYGFNVDVDSCSISNNYAGDSGGGIFANAKCSIHNSTVSQDTAQNGDGGGIYSSDSTDIKNCEILNNRSSKDGGGIYGFRLEVDSCSISNNYAGGSGGGAYSIAKCTIHNSTISSDTAQSGEGGGIYCDNNVEVMNGLMEQNRSNGDGGGVYCLSELRIGESNVLSNHSGNNGGGAYAAAIFIARTFIVGNTGNNGGGLHATALTMDNAQVSGNQGLMTGGGVFASTAEINNSTISGNHATTSGGGLSSIMASVITNSVIANNVAPNQSDITITGVVNAQHSLIKDTTNMTGLFIDLGGNIFNTDPLFVRDVPNNDSLGGDLRLQACSPGLNTGLNTSLSASDTLDLLDNPRIVYTTVDMGAYEFTDPPPPREEGFYLACPCLDTLIITDASISGLYIAHDLIEINGNATLNGETHFRAPEVSLEPTVTSPLGIRFDIVPSLGCRCRRNCPTEEKDKDKDKQ